MIQLREFTPQDLDSLFTITNFPLMQKYWERRYCETIENAKELLDLYIKSNKSKEDLTLALVFEEDINIVIGTIEISYSKIDDCFEISYYLKNSLWGKGHMATAILQSYELIRKKFGTCTIVAKTLSPTSAGVASRAGMTYIKTTPFFDVFKKDIP